MMKVTAFYGQKLGLNLNQITFEIKLKKIQAPSAWVYDLRKQNLTGSWQTIGQANWNGNQFSTLLPNNLNDL